MKKTHIMIVVTVFVILSVAIIQFVALNPLSHEAVRSKLKSRYNIERSLNKISGMISLPQVSQDGIAMSPAKTTADYSRRPSDFALRGLRVAFAITMTSDGTGVFHDGAAVLAYSILKVTHTEPRVHQLFDHISLVAFVHPNVSFGNRNTLTHLGYHVIEATTPINVSAIHGDFLREKINKNGCCGAAELIKLSSYLLDSYDFVLHLDADTYFTGSSVYELFSKLIYKDPSRGDVYHDDDKYFSLVYTTDPNMASFKKGVDKMPVQGGFILFKPNIRDYDNVIDIVRTVDFHKGRGWNRSMIGWYWGGMTVQGVLPFYYHRVSRPHRTLIVDRCKYNTMADTTECTDTANNTRNTLESGEVVSAHFTVCQKPWTCFRRFWSKRLDTEFNAKLCLQLHNRYCFHTLGLYVLRLCCLLMYHDYCLYDIIVYIYRWFELRREAELFYGLPQVPDSDVCDKKYHRMTFNFHINHNQKSSGDGKRGDGKRGARYVPGDQLMWFASQSQSYDSMYVIDESPDIIHPRMCSGFSAIVPQF